MNSSSKTSNRLMRSALYATLAGLSGLAQAIPMTFTDEASFLAAASGIPLTLESFESLTDTSSPADLGPFSLSTADGNINVTSVVASDGFRSWGIGGIFGSDYPATITFDSPVNAVGFDIIGELTLASLLTVSINSGTSPILSLNSQVPFIGIVDLMGSITSVTIVQNNQGDGAGIDRLQYGTASSVPVPATLWLFGAGLAGLAGVRRHKRT